MHIRKRFWQILMGITLVVIIAFSAQVNRGGIPIPTPTLEVFDFPEAPANDYLLPKVSDLLKMGEDEDCQLPCFAGFYLNETLIDEATTYVMEVFRQNPSMSLADEREYIEGISEPSTQNMDIQETFLPLSPDGGSLQVIFMSIDDIVVRIDIRLVNSANWLEEKPFILSEVLETYGEPTKVYMRYSGAPLVGYNLALVYENKGIVIEYGFGNTLSSSERLMDERITRNGKLLICAEDATYDRIELTLQEDGNPIQLTEVLQPDLDDPSVFRPFWNIEDMTGLSIEEFTESFVGNSNACVEAYSLQELGEQGYE